MDSKLLDFLWMGDQASLNGLIREELAKSQNG